MVTVRLPEDLQDALEKRAQEEGSSKSGVIKEALRCYLEETKPRTPYELGKELFGRYESGEGDLSTSYKERLRKKIDAKRHAR